jgi:hypothetical protein
MSETAMRQFNMIDKIFSAQQLRFISLGANIFTTTRNLFPYLVNFTRVCTNYKPPIEPNGFTCL